MPAVTGYLCTDCGRSHKPKDRQRTIRHMAHMTPVEVIEAWQCFYDDGQGRRGAGYKMVTRDLKAVRAQLRREATLRARRKGPARASSARRSAA